MISLKPLSVLLSCNFTWDHQLGGGAGGIEFSETLRKPRCLADTSLLALRSVILHVFQLQCVDPQAFCPTPQGWALWISSFHQRPKVTDFVSSSSLCYLGTMKEMGPVAAAVPLPKTSVSEKPSQDSPSLPLHICGFVERQCARGCESSYIRGSWRCHTLTLMQLINCNLLYFSN